MYVPLTFRIRVAAGRLRGQFSRSLDVAGLVNLSSGESHPLSPVLIAVGGDSK